MESEFTAEEVLAGLGIAVAKWEYPIDWRRVIEELCRVYATLDRS